MKENIAIGVDIGGSHISCAAFDLIERKYLHDNNIAQIMGVQQAVLSNH